MADQGFLQGEAVLHVTLSADDPAASTDARQQGSQGQQARFQCWMEACGRGEGTVTPLVNVLGARLEDLHFGRVNCQGTNCRQHPKCI